MREEIIKSIYLLTNVEEMEMTDSKHVEHEIKKIHIRSIQKATIFHNI